MKLNKNFFVKLGLYLALTGFVVSILGFVLSGFSPEKYDRFDDNGRPWYQVVQIWG